jgi:hypothetical protein
MSDPLDVFTIEVTQLEGGHYLLIVSPQTLVLLQFVLGRTEAVDKVIYESVERSAGYETLRQVLPDFTMFRRALYRLFDKLYVWRSR